MVKDYSFGIYKYTDKETGLIDYIGCIQGDVYKIVKSCNDYSKLQIIGDALNDGKFSEEDVKGVRSTDTLLKQLWEEC